VAGLVIAGIGLLWFSQVSPGGSFLSDVLGPSVVFAVGGGLSFVPATIGAVAGVEEHDSGLASGLINTTQQVGGAVGLAVLATIANSKTGDLVGAGPPSAGALTEGFQLAFVGAAGFVFLAAILAFVLMPSIKAPQEAPAPQVA
jgi:hypothetical protein